ncbi:MAG: regulatory protein RecX, partial [Gemmatimonadota bacterium]
RGYTDDRAFAEAFVRDRLRLRPRGQRGLLSELRGKGVDGATAEAAVAAVFRAEGIEESDLARDAAEAWARKNASTLRRARRSPEDRQRARRRLFGHLARRGFTSDVVRSAMDHVLAD